MAKAKIVIVEDEVLVARDLQSRLGNLGYEAPAIAVSGEEALEKVAELLPDLVLMDIHLKGAMDGIDVAEGIRRRHGIPVVYLTAYADEPTVARAKISEPYGYLLKPFQEKELSTVIEISLYRHEMEGKLRRAHAQLEDKVRELEGRDRLVECQMSGPTLPQAAEEVLQVVEQVVESKRAVLLLTRADSLETIATLGGPTGDLSSVAMALVSRAFHGGQPGSSPVGNQAAVPILYRDRPMGTIWVAWDRDGEPVDEDVLNSLWRLGQQAAPVIRMAQLTEALDTGQLVASDLLAVGEEGEEDGQA